MYHERVLRCKACENIWTTIGDTDELDESTLITVCPICSSNNTIVISE